MAGTFEKPECIAMHKVEEFKNYLVNKGRSHSTVILYDYVLTAFFEKYLEGKKDVNQVTKEDVEGFISWRIDEGTKRTEIKHAGIGIGRLPSIKGELKPATINYNLSALKKFFDWAQRRELADQIELARMHRWKPPLFELDLQKILDLFKDKDLSELEEITRKAILAKRRNKEKPIPLYLVKRNALLVYIIFNAGGIRIGEAANLKVSSFKFDLKVPAMLVEGKTGQRTILLSEAVAEKIKAFIKEFNIQGNLFCDKHGSALTVNSLKTYIWNMFRIGLGEKYHAHTLRHAYATFMLDNDVPIKKVSNDMGHASVSTTVIYQDTIKGKNQEAISPIDYIQGEKQ